MLSQRLREAHLHRRLDGDRQPPDGDLKAAIRELGIDEALFVDSRENEKLHLASRNVAEWKLVDALAVNVYDVMSHATVVLSQDALSRVVETLK